MSDDVGARPKRALGNRASARQWVSFNQDNEAGRGEHSRRLGSFKPPDRLRLA